MAALSQRLISIIEFNKKNTDEMYKALRLQALACDDPKQGKKLAYNLFMHSLPFVNEAYFETFISKNESLAQMAGKRCGIFVGK